MKKNVIARAGNFEIILDAGAEHDYLRIRSISGHWSVSYRDDDEMYGKILAMVRDKSYERTLEYTIVYLFHTTTVLIDAEMANDYFSALERMFARMARAQGEPTDEENEEAIEEVRVLGEVGEIINENNT